MSSHSGTIGRKRGEYYFNGDQMRRQRSAEWHSRHGYSSSEEEYQNNAPAGAFDTQLLASLLIQSQQLANIDRSYRSIDCDNEEVTESLLTDYPQQQQQQQLQQQQQSYNQNILNGSPISSAKLSTNPRNPFSLKYDLHATNTNHLDTSDRLSYSGSTAFLDKLQQQIYAQQNAELSPENSGSAQSAYLTTNLSSLTLNPNSNNVHGTLGGGGNGTLSAGNGGGTLGGTVRSSRSKNNRLNRISGMTSSSSATSSNSNQTRSERERQKLQQLQKELQIAAAVAAAKETEINNCDSSYGESIDKSIFEPPPEPAPPEIPPRAQSLLMSLRKRSDYQLKYEDNNGDQKHEEFIPTSQQKDYLATENSRSSEFPPKSITSSDSQSQQGLGGPLQPGGGGVGMGGNGGQQQITQSMSTGNNTIGGQHCQQLSGTSPLVMPGFPLRTSHSAHTPHYSPYSPSRFHIDKRCQHRCSWKCLSIALILVAVVLTAMLAYFATISSMKPNLDSSNCILVQDVKSIPHDQQQQLAGLGGSTILPTEDSTQTSSSTSDQSSSSTFTSGAGTAYLGAAGIGVGGLNTGNSINSNNINSHQSVGGLQNILPQQQQQQLMQQQHQINGGVVAAGPNVMVNGLPNAMQNGGNQALLSQQNQPQLLHPQDQSYTAQQQQLKWPQLVQLKDLNEMYHATIPPYQFWNLEFRNKHQAFIRLNFTLPWGASFAVYGRRNVAPSVTQYDFVEFIKAGRLDRSLKRKRRRTRRSTIVNGPLPQSRNDDDDDDDGFAYNRNNDNALNEGAVGGRSSMPLSEYEAKFFDILSDDTKTIRNNNKKMEKNRNSNRNSNYNNGKYRYNADNNINNGNNKNGNNNEHMSQQPSFMYRPSFMTTISQPQQDGVNSVFPSSGRRSGVNVDNNDDDDDTDDDNVEDTTEIFEELSNRIMHDDDEDNDADEVNNVFHLHHRILNDDDLDDSDDDMDDDDDVASSENSIHGNKLSSATNKRKLHKKSRQKRSSDGLTALDMDTMMVNVSLLQYLDTGLWFLSVYNDELVAHTVTLIVEEAEGVSTTCPNDCSGRGSCYLGKCDCIDGYQGADCSKSVCPVLCSAHGHYGGGVCHCEEGWKGAECDIPAGECEVPSCTNHGRCIEGECHCERGWKGPFCDQRDCIDPSCSGHGTCVTGQCYCKAGWQGEDCGTIDQQVYQCLPGCSEHGTYDLETGQCVCERHWTGPDCSQAVCSLDCGPNGVCESGKCRCNTGWTGNLCDQLPCDNRCSEHGQCKNGTCVCSQGWNGRHCTLPGCENGCSRHGQCSLEDGEYRCDCIEGWAGSDCSISLEMNCKDNIDNDNDGMADCSDSECCAHPSCSDHIMCLSSNDPVEVLLRKQPPSVTASFYQRVKFLIEENSVQSYAHVDEYTENRVSVMRGQVITPQGLGIVGIRVSVDRETRFGFTLTRQGGWFDVLVNGGGAVTLQFQRSPFKPLTRTVFVPWNRIVVLPPVQMQLSDEDETTKKQIKLATQNPALTFLNSILYHFSDEVIDSSIVCLDHDHEQLKPQLISTWMPNGVGAMPGKRVIFAETQIVQESIQIPGSGLHLTYQSSQASGYLSIVRMRLTGEKIPSTLTHVHVGVEIEGSLHVKTYEADPDLIHTFAWNKRNVYRQKVYGVTIARISVGYQHSTCKQPVWNTQTAKLQGYDVDISDIGGWGLDIHHHYNFHEGILQKGDGSTLHMKEYPRTVKVVMGTGLQRPLNCPDHCNGIAKDARLLTPIALASGPDGSLYVGDFNLVRRITPDGKVFTILQLSATQVSYQYYLAVSPADGNLYISDPEKHQILRLLKLEKVKDPLINSEAVVGSGQRCIPGDEGNCGDGGPALQARLSHPKGLAIAADKTMYIADGTNIRAVDAKGIIHTLIGHHGHHNHWSPAPCSGTLMANQAQLQWPTGLALSPLDGSLHFIDDRLVLRLTSDMKIRVVAGTPLHCNNAGNNVGGSQASKNKTTESVLGTVLAMAFSPFGDLYIADSDARRVNSIRVVDTAGNMRYFAGKQESSGSLACDCNTNVNVNGTASNGMNGSVINIGGNGGTVILASTIQTHYATTINPTNQRSTASGSNSNSGAGIGAAGTTPSLNSFGNNNGIVSSNGACICNGNGIGTGIGTSTSSGGGIGGGSSSTGSPTINSSPMNSAGSGGSGVNSLFGNFYNEDGTQSNAETLLSSNAKFQAISAIAVAQDGVINVADQGSLHILALEHYLPSHDENGEFHIPYPPTSEIYVFNRYGQHVTTKDLTSGKTRYSFLYSKNTSFGRLSTVTDSSGNKIQFLRDYSNVVSSIENTQDHKSEITINGIGIMTKLIEKGKLEIELDYDSNTGLLNSRSTGGETYIYQYDEFGRVTRMILPSGEIVRITSELADNKGLSVYVHASVQSLFSRERNDNSNELLVLGGVHSTLMKKGSQNAEAVIKPNNTLVIRDANGVIVESSAIARHPLLEAALPVEAEMLAMWSHQSITMGEGITNNMYSIYNLIGDVRNPQQTLNREIWVNNSRVIGVEFDQFTSRETFYDVNRTPLLIIAYDPSGLPKSYYPSNGYPVNITYDRFNRVDGWKWGPAELKYTYDRHGLLSEITSQQDGIISYVYNDWNLVSEIGVASQRKFVLGYDDAGGLRSVKLPSGTKHMFSMQTSIGFIRYTYIPPGGSRPYLQHFSHSGALLQTIFPGDGARILYRYNAAGQLTEIVHGDGKSEFTYNDVTGMPSTVSHSEKELEYRWDFEFTAGLLTEERIDYIARTGLSNAKFTYDYDSNFRVTSIQGRIGGQNLPTQVFAFDPRTGQPNLIGQFKILHPKVNQTQVLDGTATFTRIIDGRFLTTKVSLSIHRVPVFRMEFSYGMHGRITQTKTWTRNMAVQTYTNVKNYTWDCDGQLVGVEAQEPWGFRYDDNGNLLSLTYRGNTIPMEYNLMDRIVKFGEGQYKYDSRGLVAQNAREERFHYNTQGLLVRATKRGRFDVKYSYDHMKRLITRKDNFGNVTQFFYNNQQRPLEISQIYSPRDGKLMSLTYDDRGHLIFVQVYRKKYYVATDQSGTPIMIFNQYGEGEREIMRSPFGHIIYDSNPYFYLPIDFNGGILDQVTTLVHFGDGRVYDPLIGQWMSPNWEDVAERVITPTKMHLYRFNGNDPINVHHDRNYPTDFTSWMNKLGMNIKNLIPQLSRPLWEQPSLWGRTLKNPIANDLKRSIDNIPTISVESGFLAHLNIRRMADFEQLSAPPKSSLKFDVMNPKPLKVGSDSDPPFGKGIVVSRTHDGQAIVSSVPAANAIYRDVYTSVFNRSKLLPFTFVVHNAQQDSFFFVKEDAWRASEDRQQLKRLQGQVNTTFHEITRENGSGNNFLDVKIHGQHAIINLRYGTSVEKEKQRLMHHAKLTAVRKAWHREKESLHNGLTTNNDWTQSEIDEILKQGYVNLYEGEYVHDVGQYPELAEDPFNIKFLKKKANPIRKRRRRDTVSQPALLASNSSSSVSYDDQLSETESYDDKDERNNKDSIIENNINNNNKNNLGDLSNIEIKLNNTNLESAININNTNNNINNKMNSKNYHKSLSS